MQQGRKATRTGWERWLLTCLLACVAVFLPLSLQADDGLPDHISSRGYLMDPDGNLTLGQVEQLPFRPMPQVLALGHTSAVIWLRVDVEPMAARDLVLTLQPPYLEDVRVFLPGTGVDDWQHVRLGTHVPYTERGRSEGHIVVNLPDRATPANLRAYIRVQSVQHLVLKVQVMHAQKSLQQDMQRSLLVSFGVGLLLTLAVLGLLHWGSSRDRQWLIAAATMACMLLVVSGTAGLLDKYLFPQQPLLATGLKDVASIGYMALMQWYFLRLFRLYQAPGWTVLPNRMYLTMAPLLLLAVWLGYAREAWLLHVAVIIMYGFWGLFSLRFVRFGDGYIRVLLALLFLAQVMMVLYLELSWLGLLPLTDVSLSVLYPELAIGLLVGVAQFLVQWRRDHLALRSALMVRMRAERMEQELYWETSRREEMDGLLGMLLHELKTPLSAIRLGAQAVAKGWPDMPPLVTGRLQRIHQSVDAMNMVLDKVRHTDRMETGAWQISREPCDVQVLVQQLVAECSQPLRVRLESGLGQPVQTDPDLLRLMIGNLLENALAYSEPESEVCIHLQPWSQGGGKEGFRLRVCNRVAEGDQPDASRLFTKYYRAEHSHQHTGTGLGLYWVRHMALAMGGDIVYQGELDEVVFELTLPG